MLLTLIIISLLQAKKYSDTKIQSPSVYPSAPPLLSLSCLSSPEKLLSIMLLLSAMKYMCR